MTQKLILHIGLHKTGSTAIQNFCTANRRKLKRQGFCYPSAATRWNGHHPIAWSLGIKHPQYNPADGSTEDLVMRIKKEARDRHILLSTENFEFFGPMQICTLNDLFEINDVHIVVYLRKQSSYLKAEYAQHVRMEETRFTGSIDDFYQKFDFSKRYNYLKLLERWEKQFGKNSITVRPFQQSQFKNEDLLQDFCDASGISWNDKFQLPPPSDSNISLPDDLLTVLRELNKTEIAREDREDIISIFSRYSDRASEDLPSLQFNKALQDAFEESNSQVAKLYLNRKDGRLFS